MDEDEEWRPVVGLEGKYEVSSLGRVRSLPRVTLRADGKPLTIKGRILKTSTDSKGYLTSTLTSPDRRVHRLVCSAFYGPPPEGKDQVRHLDGDPSNNTVTNLRWGSAQENAQDIIRMGRNWNQRKKRCPKGHRYTYDVKYNARRCLTCREERRGTKGHPDPEAHGNYSTYLNWYCRCDDCREAFNEYQREYRRRRATNNT